MDGGGELGTRVEFIGNAGRIIEEAFNWVQQLNTIRIKFYRFLLKHLNSKIFKTINKLEMIYFYTVISLDLLCIS